MEVHRDRSAETSAAGPEHFTGSVWSTNYIAPATPERLSGSQFLYAPGARSHWHVHECEQAIIAVHGTGLVAWQGHETPVELSPGDWWHVTPGVPHWHGAAPNSSFAHLAVTAGGATTWLSEVSEDDYRRLR